MAREDVDAEDGLSGSLSNGQGEREEEGWVSIHGQEGVIGAPPVREDGTNRERI